MNSQQQETKAWVSDMITQMAGVIEQRYAQEKIPEQMMLGRVAERKQLRTHFTVEVMKQRLSMSGVAITGEVSEDSAKALANECVLLADAVVNRLEEASKADIDAAQVEFEKQRLAQAAESGRPKIVHPLGAPLPKRGNGN